VIAAPMLNSTYYVRFEGNCDTTAGKPVTVHVKDLSIGPSSAGSDRDSVCPGDGSVILMYTGGSLGTGATAEWYSDPLFTQWVGTGNNLNIPAPLETTDYYVRFEGDCDTMDAVTTTVYVYPAPQPGFIIQSDRLCVNAGPALYVVDGFVGSGYTWSVTGGVIITDMGDSVFVDWGSQTGDYQLEMIETTMNGCTSEPVILDIHITIPTVDLGSDQFICEGETATVTPVGAYVNLLWHDGSSSSTYVTDLTEMVSILVFDENSCVASDSMQVTVVEAP